MSDQDRRARRIEEQRHPRSDYRYAFMDERGQTVESVGPWFVFLGSPFAVIGAGLAGLAWLAGAGTPGDSIGSIIGRSVAGALLGAVLATAHFFLSGMLLAWANERRPGIGAHLHRFDILALIAAFVWGGLATLAPRIALLLLGLEVAVLGLLTLRERRADREDEQKVRSGALLPGATATSTEADEEDSRRDQLRRWADDARKLPELGAMLRAANWRPDAPYAEARALFFEVWEDYKVVRRAKGLPIWTADRRREAIDGPGDEPTKATGE